MEELVQYRTSADSHTMTSSFSSYYNSNTIVDGDMDWQSIYTLKDVASCVEKIQPVRFNEKMPLFSTLDVMAYSSGYSIGSCNWLLETSLKKIVVISASSTRAELHPSLLDCAIMQSADVILVSDLISDNNNNYDVGCKKLLSYVAGTVGARHNVILPLAITSGIVYDLIWMVQSHLRSIGMEIGPEPHQIPMYMVSPMADQSLQYANICGEWMTTDYQENLWKSEMPLPHGHLLKSGALTTFTTMASIPRLTKTKKMRTSPCIVFTGDHQVISHGATNWFIHHWGADPQNICLFTDPEMVQDQLQHYDQGGKMRMMHIPLDTRLGLIQLIELLRLHWTSTNSRSRYLLLPKSSSLESSPSHAVLQDYLSKSNDITMQFYSPGDMLDIGMNFQWEPISISSKLAKELKPKEIPWMANADTTKRMAPISGDLQIYNNELILRRTIPHLDPAFLLSSSSTMINDNDTHQAMDASEILDRLHKVIKLKKKDH
ncbi:beta-lactamase-like protein [Halteromyces radiatus]|uniref:beta-lactamase-like protein n=1 Tax=Halteromyces radiatus TaxID=101107 RepID=UPI0022203CED|nr:beta-lactamase-like protein [Halteromyces radiatus]KAI8083179.1 beta-lactamase-like protein [Halteromyces radiatus]